MSVEVVNKISSNFIELKFFRMKWKCFLNFIKKIIIDVEYFFKQVIHLKKNKILHFLNAFCPISDVKVKRLRNARTRETTLATFFFFTVIFRLPSTVNKPRKFSYGQNIFTAFPSLYLFPPSVTAACTNSWW